MKTLSLLGKGTQKSLNVKYSTEKQFCIVCQPEWKGILQNAVDYVGLAEKWNWEEKCGFSTNTSKDAGLIPNLPLAPQKEKQKNMVSEAFIW